MKKRLGTFIVVLSLAVLLAFLAGCQTIQTDKPKPFAGVGMTVSGSLQKEKATHVVFHPTYGLEGLWLKNLTGFLEGDVGYINLDGKDALQLGITAMLEYDFLKLSKNSSLYLEGGGGIGWWSDSSSDRFVSSDGVLGIAKAGGGVKFDLSNELSGKVGVRYTHYSSIMTREDRGDNSIGMHIQVDGLDSFFSKIFNAILSLFRHKPSAD